MDWDIYLRTVLALVAVVGLIGGVAWVARRIGAGGLALGARQRRRLSVVESLSIDGRRRLLLVRRDQAEHLLLVGGATDLVVESPVLAAALAAPAGPPQSAECDR
jgi:flagellar protein FliO/FliZ